MSDEKSKVVSISAADAKRARDALEDAGYDSEAAEFDGAEIRVDAETGEILDPDTGAPTGKTLEDLAAEEPHYPILQGSSAQLTLDVGGGRRPDGSVLVLKKVEVPLSGQFPRRKRLRLIIEAEVEDVILKSVKDKASGREIAVDRVHVAAIENVLPADD